MPGVSTVDLAHAVARRRQGVLACDDVVRFHVSDAGLAPRVHHGSVDAVCLALDGHRVHVAHLGAQVLRGSDLGGAAAATVTTAWDKHIFISGKEQAIRHRSTGDLAPGAVGRGGLLCTRAVEPAAHDASSCRHTKVNKHPPAHLKQALSHNRPPAKLQLHSLCLVALEQRHVPFAGVGLGGKDTVALALKNGLVHRRERLAVLKPAVGAEAQGLVVVQRRLLLQCIDHVVAGLNEHIVLEQRVLEPHLVHVALDLDLAVEPDLVEKHRVVPLEPRVRDAVLLHLTVDHAEHAAVGAVHLHPTMSRLRLERLLNEEHFVVVLVLQLPLRVAPVVGHRCAGSGL
jgi:hypothetical protein